MLDSSTYCYTQLLAAKTHTLVYSVMRVKRIIVT